MATNKMPTKNIKPTRLQAIEWINKQLLEPTARFILKPGHHINDLNECLRTQKERILFGIDPLRRLAFLRVREIKNYLNEQYK
jgi:hypothetical protein